MAPALWLCLLAGCASGPYQYGRGWHDSAGQPTCAAPSPGQHVQVVEGRPNAFLDNTGWVMGIEPKLFLWDRRASNHDVSPETTGAVVEYLERNNLGDVLVRVNQYDPAGEWQRLRENDELSPGWRYTVGALSVAQYAIFPGRIFGRDKYNPFTNSVYLFSDIPSLGLQSAAYAKDIRQRDYPGTYASFNQLPIASLWHETIATDDSLRYLAATNTPAAEQEGQRILYPHYGMCVGGAVDMVVGFGPIFELGGAVAGHMTNRYQSQQPEAPPSESLPLPQIATPDVSPTAY